MREKERQRERVKGEWEEGMGKRKEHKEKKGMGKVEYTRSLGLVVWSWKGVGRDEKKGPLYMEDAPSHNDQSS